MMTGAAKSLVLCHPVHNTFKECQIDRLFIERPILSGLFVCVRSTNTQGNVYAVIILQVTELFTKSDLI
jgi:hypothetical protein